MGNIYMQRTAKFSGPENCYRDELRRVWDEAKPLLVVCMLNPSTADHLVDDQTVLALIHFAKFWSYGGLLIVNLYALRTSSPKTMMAHEGRIGSDNGAALEAAIAHARDNGGTMLAAWGAHGGWEQRDAWFVSRATSQGVTLVCLGKTRSGAPKHPMARGKHRIPRDQQPLLWREAWPQT